jgi:aspartyl-tRNA synthetase
MKRELIKNLISKENGSEVCLSGWVDSKRDLGNLIFIYLRDISGLVQVVFDPEKVKDVWEQSRNLKPEWVIRIKGNLSFRPGENVLDQHSTGNIEVLASELEILNDSKILPYELKEGEKIKEELRLKYRYLDLRRKELKDNIVFRSEIFYRLREFLHKEGFIEIETPILIKSTPEGARDFIVPSRNFPKKFYALPQSPQLLKQLLQVAGFEKYYQMARCFRDEDLRADRQPEFTQLDIEMSFIEMDDIIDMVERLVNYVLKEVLNINLEIPIQQISYNDAMERYGSDKPDIRFELLIENFTDDFRDIDFKILQTVIDSGNRIRGIRIENVDYFSRKKIDLLTNELKNFGIPGMIYIKRKNGEISSSIKKFLTEDIISKLNIKDGETVLILAGSDSLINPALSYLRNKLGRELNFVKAELGFLWVVDFPLLEFDSDSNTWTYKHHPFTQPFDPEKLMKGEDLAGIKARAYDLILNGEEVAGGSIRNHDIRIQKQIFKTMGIPEEVYMKQFGFLLEALEFGAPPHGGIAFGMARFVASLIGIENIRNVMAFPKTTSGNCLMTGAPDSVSAEQLHELKIKIIKNEKE